AAALAYEAPVPTIYSLGKFQQVSVTSGSDYYTIVDSYYPGDSEILGALRPLQPWYVDWWRNRVSHQQSYYQRFFDDAASGTFPAQQYLFSQRANASEAYQGGPALASADVNAAGVEGVPLYEL